MLHFLNQHYLLLHYLLLHYLMLHYGTMLILDCSMLYY